ncbi:DUF4244 domain-containing protein [Bifidobacterium sp. BRDM6]|uniref:DUF4244 domain-containing protein n=2 Tax=Bifidobacterium choloepi TaxID=2614131 RepID=A0A6I5N2G5_9BIFI|nr:DUF4244 domain-containing protein [Bifidobacterium choloepi]
MTRMVLNNDVGRPLLEPKVGDRMERLTQTVRRGLVALELRMRSISAEPEEGAATAEYAVVLVAATGFAAVLMAILKSDTVKTTLTNIIQNALSVS